MSWMDLFCGRLPAWFWLDPDSGIPFGCKRYKLPGDHLKGFILIAKIQPLWKNGVGGKHWEFVEQILVPRLVGTDQEAVPRLLPDGEVQHEPPVQIEGSSAKHRGDEEPRIRFEGFPKPCIGMDFPGNCRSGLKSAPDRAHFPMRSMDQGSKRFRTHSMGALSNTQDQ